jgi:hypothetical protein
MFFCNLSTKNISCLKSVRKEKDLTLKHIQISQYSSIEVMLCKNCVKDVPGLLDEPVKPVGMFKGIKDYYDDLDKKLLYGEEKAQYITTSEKSHLNRIIELLQMNGNKMYTAQIAKELKINLCIIYYYQKTNPEVLTKHLDKTTSGNKTILTLLKSEITTKDTKKNQMIKILEERKCLSTNEMANALKTYPYLVTAMINNNKSIFSFSAKPKTNRTSIRGGYYENLITLREGYKDALKRKKVCLK